MKSTFSILFYAKRNGVKANGNMPIMGRITINGATTQFTAKVEVNPDYWNVKAGKAIGRSREVQEVNAVLDSIKTTMTKIYRDLQEKESHITPERIKNIFFGLESKNKMLREVFQLHINNIEKLVGINITKITYGRYILTLNRLLDFIKGKYGLDDIALKDINYQFLKDFEIYLLTTYQCKMNYTLKFLQRLKSVILLAKNNGWIQSDPFVGYKLRFTKEDRGYLTQEELDRIREKKFSSPRLEQVRDIFIFSCYTGLCFVDVCNLKRENVQTLFDDKLWIIIKRQKTDTPSNIPLLAAAKEILDKYSGMSNGKLLPISSNQKTNEYLKEIGELCNINKRITYHLSRHTFATTVTLANGVPIETVSKMLGHNSIKTTQIYARITCTKIGIDMNALAEKLNQERTFKSGMDILFESLNFKQKRILFNLPQSFEEGNEEMVNKMWNSFSQKEKEIFWDYNHSRISGSEPKTLELTVNQ